MPKISVGESFTVAIILGIKKVWIKGGGHKNFPSKIFCPTEPKVSVGESVAVAIISGIEKVWIRGGGGGGSIKIFRRNFFVSQCRKISWASFQCLRNFGVSKNFMHNRGYHKFPFKLFCLTVPKNFVKEHFSVSLIWGLKKC